MDLGDRSFMYDTEKQIKFLYEVYLKDNTKKTLKGQFMASIYKKDIYITIKYNHITYGVYLPRQIEFFETR